MRWLVILVMNAWVLACDSNPTPHPSRGEGVTGGEIGGNHETDRDDFADAMSPTAEPDGADKYDSNSGLAGDANDDANETSAAHDATDDADGAPSETD